MKSRILFVLAALAGLAGAVEAQRFVPRPDPDHPRIRFADSLLSLNDGCAVTGAKLNLRVHPVYVNGRPVGFC